MGLTPAEQAHIARGGRVFLVDEVPGPLYRVLVLRKDASKVLLKPDGAAGYATREDAIGFARMIANLAADDPLIHGDAE